MEGFYTEKGGDQFWTAVEKSVSSMEATRERGRGRPAGRPLVVYKRDRP